ncbi:hypothetical protein [Micromonospora cathayae]|uniref:Uncharacterized protein n=1 Tax=Micromonospora cathayae TaxID=3028804 RepID=A0ABY7ZTW4_9ACTN|nr:hypothetical protein [Micromonospora sp. HUAS 3]WDZ86494.1 hypothetical protein PVK37_08905 [Micromonospora sp. HUAS 3]
MQRPLPVPLAPRHRRDWRTCWRRCSCGLPWPCPDRHAPVPVEPATPAAGPAYPMPGGVPAASAAWAVSGVTDELREAYVMVANALVLLERLGGGATDPVVRAARYGADLALDLADEAERLLGLGVQWLRRTPGRRGTGGDRATTLAVVAVRLGAAADRIDRFPHRIRVAEEQLRAARRHDPTVAAVSEQWVRAAEQLDRSAASLRGTVAALAPGGAPGTAEQNAGGGQP